MWYFFMPQGVLHPLHAWSGAPGPLAKPKLTSKHIANIAYPNPSPGSGTVASYQASKELQRRRLEIAN